MKKKSSDFKYDTKEYYKARVIELEKERDVCQDTSDYYQTELAKSHAILGRVIHQHAERWDSVNLTQYFPTNNLWRRKTVGNPKGEKS